MFSASPAGLVIDPATGQIIPSESKPGLYTVTLTSGGACPYTSRVFVKIVTSPDPAFTYNGPFCQGAADPLPVFTTTSSAGVFLVSKKSSCRTGNRQLKYRRNKPNCKFAGNLYSYQHDSVL